jgi:hypothetical protein
MGRISGYQIRRVHYIALTGKSQFISFNISRFAMHGINYFNQQHGCAGTRGE